MGCISSAPSQTEGASSNNIPLKRTITLTAINSGLVRQVSLKSSSNLDHSMVEELLLSKHGLYYTILNTYAVIDLVTCELLGYLDEKGELNKQENDHVKEVASKYNLIVNIKSD